MLRSNVKRRRRVPDIRTSKTQTKDYEFVKGLDTNSSNDDVSPDSWRYLTDSRQIQIGKWRTRYGADFFSVPIGEAVNAQQNSTTGASTYSFSNTARFAQRLEATSTARVSALEANIYNDDGATGTVVLALHDDDSGEVGDEIFRTTISNADIGGSAAYEKGRSVTAPEVTNGAFYWIVGYVQDGGSGSYKITTTTDASTGNTSADSGQTWTDEDYSFNVKLSTATSGGVKGLIRLKRPNGTSFTFFAHGTSLYSVNESTGATSAVDTGLHADTTYVRFAFVNDVLYYVTGLQKPRKYDFSAAAEVSAAPETAAHIIEHKGIVFYGSATDTTKEYYTNFASYETFTSTDFLYVPAPKTADPIRAFAKLNGVKYTLTRNNKYALYGSDNATFRLDNAIGQKGTFSQESVTWDEDYMYLANDDGIFRFNGAEEVNIARDILGSWIELLDKDNTVLELHDNRLYVWYTPNGESDNSRCFVFNTVYEQWESTDTKAYVSRAHARFDTDNYFLQGSNRIGTVMLAERTTNDWNVLGEPLTHELHTAYNHYGTPAQFKRAPIFRPHFDSESQGHDVQVGYATDYSDAPTYVDVSLAGSGPTFNSGFLFDDENLFGGTQQVNPMDSAPAIPGEWRRLQIRYRHEAAREPFSFDGHILAIETQRLM